MDLRLRESTHLQTKAEEKRRHGVPYGYGGVDCPEQDNYGIRDGRYVRVVRPDTTTMIERNPSWTYTMRRVSLSLQTSW
jgi:hypothetical protein